MPGITCQPDPLSDLVSPVAPDQMACSPKSLPDDVKVVAAATAVDVNPSNRPRLERVIKLIELFLGMRSEEVVLTPLHIALVTAKKWPASGVRLSVSFMEFIAEDLKARILSYMNVWGAYCNASFAWTAGQGQVRISRGQGGYWSYIGTDILHIPLNQQTMNLQAITMQTSSEECMRVIVHEVGHTLAAPHEHMRRELVSRLDPARTIAYFGRTQGWSPSMVRQQVLTPLEESSLLGTEHADEESIMCYQISGECTVDGRPIIGGVQLSEADKVFIGKMYPLPVQPPAPPPPVGQQITLSATVAAGTYTLTKA